MFWCEYGISQCFFQDFTDCPVILFLSDCGLIFRGPTAARADKLPGPEPGTVFNSNSSCDRIIDIGLPVKAANSTCLLGLHKHNQLIIYHREDQELK